MSPFAIKQVKGPLWGPFSFYLVPAGLGAIMRQDFCLPFSCFGKLVLQDGSNSVMGMPPGG
jgi:hypothetical protein